MEYLYRYQRCGSFDGKTSIILLKFEVIRKTEKTAWVRRFGAPGSKQIKVRTGADRPWAYPTEPEAYEHFIHRTQYSVSYCKGALERAEEYLNAYRNNTIEKLDHNYNTLA